jgi:hypothetical protein
MVGTLVNCISIKGIFQPKLTGLKLGSNDRYWLHVVVQGDIFSFKGTPSWILLKTVLQPVKQKN